MHLKKSVFYDVCVNLQLDIRYRLVSDLSNKTLKMVVSVLYILARKDLKIESRLLQFIYPLIYLNWVIPLLLVLFLINRFGIDVKMSS
jgi:hypothetical protein